MSQNRHHLNTLRLL